MCICPCKPMIESEKGESIEGNMEKREDTERSNESERGKRETAEGKKE